MTSALASRARVLRGCLTVLALALVPLAPPAIADATPSAEHPGAFVAAMNVTYFACLVLMIVALLASFMRGGTKIEAASSAGTL